MSEQKQNVNSTLFTKDNYTWMLIGGAVIALGMFLMSGGKSTDPKVFNTNEVYGTTRITIAPILIVLGLLIEVYAIFKKQKTA
ncbi:MAG: DUF3098 domain-containing protein [Bacteroidetes bacterium]|nr:DUF3098 domain-containing protein [Bacteroidota bacterium]